MKKLLAVTLVMVFVLGLMGGAVVADGPETATVTVRVEDVDGEPIAGVQLRLKYSETGPTSYFPQRHTDENGEATAEFDVGKKIWIIADWQGTASAWQNKVVEAEGTEFLFVPTQVTITSSYQISFGGSGGDARYFKRNAGLYTETQDLFPGTYNFNFRGGEGLVALAISGGKMNLAEVAVNVNNFDGDPLEGVQLRYRRGTSSVTLYFPIRYTDEAGWAGWHFPVGTILHIEASRLGTAQWQTQEIIEDKNLFEFTPTKLTIESPYRVSFGGPTGIQRWFKNNISPEPHSLDLFAGTYVFNFRDLGLINLTIAGDEQYIEAYKLDWEWQPPVYEGMSIDNHNKTTPFKVIPSIAGFPLINELDGVSIEIGGVPYEVEFTGLEYVAHFKVNGSGLGVGEHFSVVFYKGYEVASLGFTIK